MEEVIEQIRNIAGVEAIYPAGKQTIVVLINLN